ncbi:UNKNOWN [Stylonychia lemnae]|uniref:Uncharacterized protein n=1 Tax=Stylonychia lemnae TaxID=5949 RepID=A0A078AE94_STYLE|nr:UNKNOWN [Stylonychia lemnae]|eukprot:CDW80156.1 UNKNOWN [Stylonychia lemnae]
MKSNKTQEQQKAKEVQQKQSALRSQTTKKVDKINQKPNFIINDQPQNINADNDESRNQLEYIQQARDLLSRSKENICQQQDQKKIFEFIIESDKRLKGQIQKDTIKTTKKLLKEQNQVLNSEGITSNGINDKTMQKGLKDALINMIIQEKFLSKQELQEQLSLLNKDETKHKAKKSKSPSPSSKTLDNKKLETIKKVDKEIQIQILPSKPVSGEKTQIEKKISNQDLTANMDVKLLNQDLSFGQLNNQSSSSIQQFQSNELENTLYKKLLTTAEIKYQAKLKQKYLEKTQATYTENQPEYYNKHSLEQIQELISQKNKELKTLNITKRRLQRNKMMTDRQKDKFLIPMEKDITKSTKRVALLEEVRETKVPFYEKLPKETREYEHFQNLKRTNDIKSIMIAQIYQQRMLLNQDQDIQQ